MKIHIGKYPGPKSKKSRIERIKIERWDTWNMDHTLALIILPMLKQLKTTKHGAPFTQDEDVPEAIRSTSAKPKENEWDTDEFHHDRWEWILDELIWTFTQLVDEEADSQFYSGECDWMWQAIDKDQKPVGEPAHLGEEHVKSDFYMMVEGPNHTFKADYEAMKVWDERIQKGLILFGKYYRNLWD